MRKQGNWLTGLCLVVIMGSFWSLALPVANAKSPDSAAVLKQRANQYWNYKVKNKWEKAYAFEDPAQIKGVSLTAYIRSLGPGVKWLGAKVEKVAIDGKKARVTIALRYLWSFAAPTEQPKNGFQSTFFDGWKLVDGTWYHIYHKSEPSPIPGSKPVDKTKPEHK